GATHLAPGGALGRVQSDERPHFALAVFPVGDDELAGQIHRSGVERLGRITARPALRRIVVAAWADSHAHRHERALRDQAEAASLGFGIVKIVPVGHGYCSLDEADSVGSAEWGELAHLAMSAPRSGASSRSRRPERSLAG